MGTVYFFNIIYFYRFLACINLLLFINLFLNFPVISNKEPHNRAITLLLYIYVICLIMHIFHLHQFLLSVLDFAFFPSFSLVLMVPNHTKMCYGGSETDRIRDAFWNCSVRWMPQCIWNRNVRMSSLLLLLPVTAELIKKRWAPAWVNQTHSPDAQHTTSSTQFPTSSAITFSP